MRYREFRPRTDLAETVVCTWERTIPEDSAPPTSRVLPDGCVDLVWRGGKLLIAGPDRGPVINRLPPGETIVGLRLRPGRAGPALGLPASELLDVRVSLEEVWGAPGAALEDRVAQAATPHMRRRVLENSLLARLHDMERPDPLVLAATRRLGLPGSRVGALSEVLGTSERQLLRRFDAAVGYGPKTLDRVLRFRRFLSSAPAVAAGGEGLARVAAELGYADQAHLTRECVRLSGLTPARLVASS